MADRDFFAKRVIPEPKQINFLVGTKTGDEGHKAYLVELDPSYQCRVGDLLTATDSRTSKRYLMLVSDIDPAYTHREEHAEMLDLLRRRPDKQIDEPTFNALCKNMAICTLMGEISESGIVENGYRPNKYTTTAEPTGPDIEQFLVAEWKDGVDLGYLRKGRQSRSALRVHFPTVDLVGARFLIVGQTGKGKSNAMRRIIDKHLHLMNENPKARRVGFLVDDFKMEYPFDSHNQRGETVPGLVNRLGHIAKRRLVILTCNPARYAAHADRFHKILRLHIPLDGLTLSVFGELADLTTAQTNVVHLVEETGRMSARQFFDDLLSVDEFGVPNMVQLATKFGPLFYSKKGREKARRNAPIENEEDIDQNLGERLAYIRRAALRMLKMPFVTRNAGLGDCVPELFTLLSDGCTVIVDKDGLEDHQRELLTITLLFHLFRHNQELASGTEEQRRAMVPVVVAVEEAQYLLSKEKVADPDSIFAKIAFTGRSYKIGLVAITQRPQAIQKELLGQFDGFLVLPMEHLNDFKHLADASPALSGYREDLASAPIGGGVLAFGTPKRVVSIQIDDYAVQPSPAAALPSTNAGSQISVAPNDAS